MSVNLEEACRILSELSTDEKLARKIHTAMIRCHHTYHDTPKGEPAATFDQLREVIHHCCSQMMKALESDPSVDRQRVGTGGIWVSYFRWNHGSEEIELRYTPEGMSLSFARG